MKAMYLYLALFLLPLPVLSDDEQKVVVQGSCEISVVPDRASVTFTAENQSKNQKEAVNRTNREINGLKEKIKAMNLPDLELKNTSYSVWPVREYEKDKYVDKGLRATLSLQVTTSDVARLGEVMAEASKLSIKNVGSLTTFLSLDKRRETYARCLEIAADDAKAKARQLAKKLDFDLGPVIKVDESPVSDEGPRDPRPIMKTMMAADVESTSIEAGEQKFMSTLQVSFRIK